MILCILNIMKTKLPDNFQPDEKTYIWSLKKHGYYDLPDMFISDFRSHHAAKGGQYTDWQRCLKNWINWSSPSGKYPNSKRWESAIEKCKSRMKAEKIKLKKEAAEIIKSSQVPKTPDRNIAIKEFKKAMAIVNEEAENIHETD